MEMMAEKSAAACRCQRPARAARVSTFAGPSAADAPFDRSHRFQSDERRQVCFPNHRQVRWNHRGLRSHASGAAHFRRSAQCNARRALDVVALQSGTFWKPVTSNIVLVAEDNTQKRTAYEEEEVETFYLANSDTGEEMNDIQTALRTLLNLRHMAMVKSSNAIVIRATPDTMMLVRPHDRERLIRPSPKWISSRNSAGQSRSVPAILASARRKAPL